jgi:hypothetical protein
MHQLTIEVEQETDGRWLAEAPDLPGVLAYGQNRREAVRRVQALAYLRGMPVTLAEWRAAWSATRSIWASQNLGDA